jgi:5-dehydro-2-deoxygluconokinase
LIHKPLIELLLDLITIGRVSVDLYGQQIGSRLEDIATFAKAVGGCPANVAIGAARLGLRSALITRVGDEPMGRFVREQLAREGVDTAGVRIDPQRLTSLVLLSVRDAQSFPLVFYRENCADGALSEQDIDEEFIASARAVVVTGTHFSLPGAARAQHKAIAAARAHGRSVILDIDYRPNLWGLGGHDAGESRYARSAGVTRALAPVLPECALIVGTEEEMHIAAGVEDTLAAIRAIRALSAALIVCKRGARGCVVFEREIPTALEDALIVPGLDIETYNVLGAGDAFLAGFLKGYLRGASHEQSARLGNACGALAVSRLLCSPEFPTLAELDHFLAHGSRHRALRHDPQLNHLHRVTTRRPQPQTLRILIIAEGAQQRGSPGAAEPASEQLVRFQELAVEAVARVGAGQAGCGVLLEGSQAESALRRAGHDGLWLARAVQRAAGHASELTAWPIDTTVHFRYRPEEPRAVREGQERALQELAALCRAHGRELLVELVGVGEQADDADALARVLSHLYTLDIRPDWWLLEPPANRHAWEQCVQVIAGHDAWCRGVLVALESPPAGPVLMLARGIPLVRGFVAGASIFADTATAWLAGQLSEDAVVAEVAGRFGALVEAWRSTD